MPTARPGSRNQQSNLTRPEQSDEGIPCACGCSCGPRSGHPHAVLPAAAGCQCVFANELYPPRAGLGRAEYRPQMPSSEKVLALEEKMTSVKEP